MNDLVSLQKDSGLIAVLGVVDAIRAAQIETAIDFNYTPYVVAGVLFCCSPSRWPAHRPLRPQEGLPRGRGPSTPRFLPLLPPRGGTL